MPTVKCGTAAKKSAWWEVENLPNLSSPHARSHFSPRRARCVPSAPGVTPRWIWPHRGGSAGEGRHRYGRGLRLWLSCGSSPTSLSTRPAPAPPPDLVVEAVFKRLDPAALKQAVAVAEEQRRWMASVWQVAVPWGVVLAGGAAGPEGRTPVPFSYQLSNFEIRFKKK